MQLPFHGKELMRMQYYTNVSLLRPGSQYLASQPEVNVNAWANARIEPSSILAFAHVFTLTSGRDARYCEPGLRQHIIKPTLHTHGIFTNGGTN